MNGFTITGQSKSTRIFSGVYILQSENIRIKNVIIRHIIGSGKYIRFIWIKESKLIEISSSVIRDIKNTDYTYGMYLDWSHILRIENNVISNIQGFRLNSGIILIRATSNVRILTNEISQMPYNGIWISPS